MTNLHISYTKNNIPISSEVAGKGQDFSCLNVYKYSCGITH